MDGFSAVSPRALVARCGAHPARELGFDLDDDVQIGHWLVAVAAVGRRTADADWRRGVGALARAELGDPAAIASAGPEPIEAALAACGIDDAEAIARKLARLCASLVARHGGSVDALAGGCDGLEALGASLVRLAPGFGPAAVARFLRPLRDRWHAAAEIPLHRDAHAAAVCLGWIDASQDELGEPGALRAALREHADPAPLADVEAALERLGAAACRRRRPGRCPLREGCGARRALAGES